MKILTAILLYSAIILAVFQNWLWLGGLFVFIFSLRFGAVTLIPLAILIDGYFGNFHHWPYLSIFSIIWYIFIDYLRPKILNPNLVKNGVWQN
jgi:hypothetical protein